MAFKWSDRARDGPFVLEEAGGTLNESVMPFAVITQRQKVAGDYGCEKVNSTWFHATIAATTSVSLTISISVNHSRTTK